MFVKLSSFFFFCFSFPSYLIFYFFSGNWGKILEFLAGRWAPSGPSPPLAQLLAQPNLSSSFVVFSKSSHAGCVRPPPHHHRRHSPLLSPFL